MTYSDDGREKITKLMKYLGTCVFGLDSEAFMDLRDMIDQIYLQGFKDGKEGKGPK